MKIIKLLCEECGNSFDRLLKEYKRNEKLGRKVFCGRKCQAIHGNKNRGYDFYINHCYDISQHSGNRLDTHSPFRYFMGKCKQKLQEKNMVFDIDLTYLEELWNKQNGICPYTKIKMILPSTLKSYKVLHSLKRASLDRIDSTNGYIKGNVEFVCLGINFAKNDFSKIDMISFINEIKQNTFSVTQEQPT